VLINVIFLRKITLLIFILMLAAIFIGGTMPGAGNLFSAPWDKVAHFFTFGAITLLAGLSFPNRPLVLILLLAVCIGIADEVHQMFIAGRQPGLDDLAADTLGALFALPLILSLRKFSIDPDQRLQLQR
jgi:VanZ family protein